MQPLNFFTVEKIFSGIQPTGNLHLGNYLGAITNFANVFEGELWTFWWPTAMVPKYDGVKYPMIPPITDQDKKSLF